MTFERSQPFPRTQQHWFQQTAPKHAPSPWSSVVKVSPAQVRADIVLNELLGFKEAPGGRPITYSTVRRAHNILAGAMTRDSLFAAISPSGDGSISMFWKAGRRSIEIELEEGNCHYVRLTGADGNTSFEDEGTGAFPRDAFREALREMSEHIALVNPSWRELVDKQ